MSIAPVVVLSLLALSAGNAYYAHEFGLQTDERETQRDAVAQDLASTERLAQNLGVQRGPSTAAAQAAPLSTRAVAMSTAINRMLAAHDLRAQPPIPSGATIMPNGVVNLASAVPDVPMTGGRLKSVQWLIEADYIHLDDAQAFLGDCKAAGLLVPQVEFNNRRMKATLTLMGT